MVIKNVNDIEFKKYGKVLSKYKEIGFNQPKGMMYKNENPYK